MGQGLQGKVGFEEGFEERQKDGWNLGAIACMWGGREKATSLQGARYFWMAEDSGVE